MIEAKSYHKYELAALYNVTDRVFGEWLKKHEEALKATGYHRNQKILTPRQVKLIFERLGEP
ncbi:DUF4248 domain-containing protein [Ekhidna sp.]|uniref:DUF4248 domain-containing protein n=1 Tax=Ekhidna sp. TaxID=2608089 RepID=UPI0032EF647E